MPFEVAITNFGAGQIYARLCENLEELTDCVSLQSKGITELGYGEVAGYTFDLEDETHLRKQDWEFDQNFWGRMIDEFNLRGREEVKIHFDSSLETGYFIRVRKV